MALKYPFVKNTDTSLRNLWNRRVYEYLDEFFRKAYFDQNSPPVVSDDPNAERSIDSYRRAGADDGWALPCGGGSGSGAWSGFVWWLGSIKWDFSRVAAAPDGEALADGIAVEGVYLKVKLIDGSTAWADSIGDDVDEYNYYPVGVRSGEDGSYVYSLSTGRVVGDIRIDFVPFHAPLEDEAEE